MKSKKSRKAKRLKAMAKAPGVFREMAASKGRHGPWRSLGKFGAAGPVRVIKPGDGL